MDETGGSEVDALVAAAVKASDIWARESRFRRAEVLDNVADHLDRAGDELVPLAVQESHLPTGRLTGELVRTTFQLRMFANVLREGSYLDARIDHADPDYPMGAPRPDLRRILQPLGPVVVFAASNFPFAFSVAGGDTASALAAGCAVLLKSHPGHPRLSAATAAVVQAGLAAAGAPDGLFALIDGDEAGRAALVHPAIRAGAFTGSIRGGRALFDLCTGRPEPIPFYGELGSVNPVFVTRAAADRRAGDIAAGFLSSFTLGAGQFCTKPGLLAVPGGSPVLDALTAADLPGAAPMLNERIQSGYLSIRDELAAHPGVTVLTAGPDETSPTLLRTTVSALLDDPDGLLRECFGPTAVVAEYSGEDELLALADALDGQLTATLAAEPDDEVAIELTRKLSSKAGRVLWNQWPTGVSVTDAQQHGGPYPATTAPGTTSVGTAAITRFLRPVAYQGYPQHLLPAELRDDAVLPRRVDGRAV